MALLMCTGQEEEGEAGKTFEKSINKIPKSICEIASEKKSSVIA